MHHITKIENLESILESKSLKARNFVEKNFADTANDDIINKRKDVNGKNLNDYVPFHNDHLQKEYGISYNYKVCTKFGKENMIYLIFNTTRLVSSPYNECLFYLYHPVCTYAELCEDLGSLSIKMENELINLPKIVGTNHLNFKSKKVQEFLMSELLVYKMVSLFYLEKIYVYNDEIEERVKILLNKYGYQNIKIEVKSDFYKC